MTSLASAFASVVLTWSSFGCDISHIGCHGGYLPCKLSSHLHPTAPVMVVGSAPSC